MRHPHPSHPLFELLLLSGLLFGLAGCGIRLTLGARHWELSVGPTAAIQPTYTFQPTLTPYPSFTPLITYTPEPSLTPRPTYTLLPFNTYTFTPTGLQSTP